MGIGDSLRTLGRFLDACEQQPQVENVALRDDWCSGATGTLAADVELSLPTRPSADGRDPMSLCGASVDADGAVRLTFETVAPVVPARGEGVELEPVDATFDPDGGLSVTLSASAPADGGDGESVGLAADGSSSHPDGESASSSDRPVESATTTSETDDSNGTQRDREVPPFRDYDLLCEVYDSCETFAEMPDVLGMDVTAETVRRYMIDYGIHEPNSYDVSGNDDGDPVEADTELETPVVLADGIGLPDDVTVDTLVETVRTSNTIYEVQNGLRIERDDALELLEQLDLVGHVVGRLATKDERSVSRELVVERLRQTTESR